MLRPAATVSAKLNSPVPRKRSQTGTGACNSSAQDRKARTPYTTVSGRCATLLKPKRRSSGTTRAGAVDDAASSRAPHEQCGLVHWQLAWRITLPEQKHPVSFARWPPRVRSFTTRRPELLERWKRPARNDRTLKPICIKGDAAMRVSPRGGPQAVDNAFVTGPDPRHVARSSDSPAAAIGYS